MKAIQIDAFGGPQVFHAVEVPLPTPGAGQVRIALKAIGVNPFDAKVRSGAMQSQFATRLPAILGNEISGVVDEVGVGVTGLVKGDEVFGWSDGGAYAQYAVGTIVALKPKSASFEQAAALPVAGETASRVLDTLKITSGDTLLIHGAAGVVGNMGVQLALLRGATVIGTAAEKDHPALQKLGAIPIAYGEGLVARVRALGKPIDAVFDAAGKGALRDSIELRGGTDRIVTIADNEAGKLGVVFSVGTAKMRSTDILRTISELADAGKVTTRVAATMPLDEVRRAHEAIESGHAAGKLVLLP